MEDFEWFMMTIICIAVAIALFMGVMFFIQVGFGRGPGLDITGMKETNRKQTELMKDLKRSQDQARDKQEELQKDLERMRRDQERRMRDLQRKSR